MNILYINHYAGSIYHGMEYRPYYLAREWVKLGHNVTIVASDKSHLRQKNPIITKDKEYLFENIDGINYIWCKTSEYQENGVKRVINIFSFLKQVYKLKLAKKIKPDLVIASSTYPFDTLLAKRIAKQAKAKFVYEVHDLWPLTPIEVGGMNPRHPFIMAMQFAENYGYNHADKVVSLLPCAKNYMLEHGMIEDKFVYSPNGVVLDEWISATEKIPGEHENFINKVKKEGKFIIGYAGGMGESNALNYLLEAAKLVQNHNIQFILVGKGANKESLSKQVVSEKIKNIKFLPAISKLQIPDFLSRCDALYIGWHNLPIYRFGISPNKLFDYMLAAKPIIHSVSAGNNLVAKASCGISVPAEDLSAIAKACDKMAELDIFEREELGQRGYEYVIKHNEYAILAEKFLKDCGF